MLTFSHYTVSECLYSTSLFEKQIASFRPGDLMMLCTFYLLTAVFNLPSVLYLPMSVKSVLYEK